MALNLNKQTGDSFTADEFNQIIAAVNKMVEGVSGKGLSTNDYTSEEKEKLKTLVNVDLEPIVTELGKKVNSIPGKSLSTNDYTNEDRLKLESLENLDTEVIYAALDDKANKNDTYTKQEVDTKVLASKGLMSVEEQEVGALNYQGKNYTIYESTVEILQLPSTVNEVKSFIISNQPLGDNLYLKVECFSLASDGDFPISAYEVKKIYEDANKNTVADIVCHEVIAPPYKALLTFKYIKGLLSFKNLTIKIPLTNVASNLDNVSITIPPCKYNKSFALSFVGDDSLMGIYQKAFNYVHGRYVDNKDIFHDGDTPTAGITPVRKLTYTDGCDNEITFRLGVNWMNGSDTQNLHENGNKFLPYMWWNEGIRFHDYNNAIMNHGGGDQTKPIESIMKNQKLIKDNINIYPYVLGVPGGTTGYPEAVDLLDYIYSLESSNFQASNERYPKLSDVAGNIMKKRFGRTCLDTFTDVEIKSIITQNGMDSRWINLFCHNIKIGTTSVNGQLNQNICFSFLDYIYDTYGKGGSDTVWFANNSEIYEYLFIRNNSVISKKVEGSNLVISVKAAALPNFYHNEASFVLSGVSSFSGMEVSDNIVNFSAKGDLLNVSYSERIEGLTEKYVSIYESNKNDINKKEAYFFINQLKNSLKIPFIDRVENGSVEIAPVLKSISINSGASTTTNPSVNIVLSVTGDITHYRISESADLSTVNWIAGNSKTVSFNLSTGYSVKTVYIQVKNDIGESDTKSSTITLQEVPPEVTNYIVTGAVNNSNFGTVSPATQTVNEGGTANLTATAKTGYVIESWTGTSNSTGVGSASGSASVTNVQSNKTVTCNFKATETPPDPTKLKSIISTGWDYGAAIGYDSTTGISKVMNATNKPIFDTSGNNIGLISRITDNPAVVVRGLGANNAGAITGDDSGIYPDIYLAHTMYAHESTKIVFGYTITIPSGNYRVKIYSNSSSASAVSSLATYAVNGAEKTPTFPIQNNLTEFLVFENIVVTDKLEVSAWTDGGYKYAPINVIEIEEV